MTRTASNDNYAWTGAVAVNRAYTVNALNQYTASGSIVPTYDGRGNLTSAGPTSYTYDSKNELIAAGTNSLFYDALGHLDTITGSSTTRLAYDGSDLLTETDGSDATLRRYVHGPGTDEVIVWYEGSGTSNKRWLARDERGSVTLVTDASGAQVGINTYDDYGIPGASNVGRFQYTGQTWIPELGMYYYKARVYSPTLGRFLQTDPIGYDDGLNWYNYAHGDPVNGRDPSGTLYYDTYDEYDGTWGENKEGSKGGGYFNEVVVTANRRSDLGTSVGSNSVVEIVVTAPRKPAAAKQSTAPPPPANLPNGPYVPKPDLPGNRAGSYQGPPRAKGPRSQAQWVPPESEGGPPGSNGYWKTQSPGQQGWDRFDQEGNPLSPDEAHPNPNPERSGLSPSSSIFYRGGVVGIFLCALLCADPAR